MLDICRDVSSISKIRAEIHMRSGLSLWAKIRQKSADIDIQELLKEYWDSIEHEFTVPSQSRPPTSPPISNTKHRGRYDWKVQWVSRVAILCKHCRTYLCNCPSQLAPDVRLGGLSPLIASSTRRFIKAILSADEEVDREGYG